jgi:hypothetical protein
MCLLDSSRLTTVVTNSFTTKLRVADKHLHAKCPMCKREGVFEKAIQLKALGNLASELYAPAHRAHMSCGRQWAVG